MTAPAYTLVAIDGADDDGGTLYVLYDEHGCIVSGASWPHPLEALAHAAGLPLRRLTYSTERADCDVPAPRRVVVE